MPVRTIKDTTGADISVESLRDKTKITDLTGKDIVLGGVDAAGAIVAIDPAAIASKPKWKKITSFQNNWSEQAPDVLGNLAYCLDSNGFVSIEGVIKGGAANTVAFTIPDANYRPTLLKTRYGNEQNGGKAGVVIGTDGTVTVYTSSTYTVGQWVAINVSYPVSQVFF